MQWLRRKVSSVETRTASENFGNHRHMISDTKTHQHSTINPALLHTCMMIQEKKNLTTRMLGPDRVDCLCVLSLLTPLPYALNLISYHEQND